MEFLRPQNLDNTNVLKGGNHHNNGFNPAFMILPIMFGVMFVLIFIFECTSKGKEYRRNQIAKIGEAWEHGALQAHNQHTPQHYQNTHDQTTVTGGVMPVVYRPVVGTALSGTNYTTNYVSGPNGEILQTAFYIQPGQQLNTNDLITPVQNTNVAVANANSSQASTVQNTRAPTAGTTTFQTNPNISPMFLEHQRNLAAAQQTRNTAPPLCYGTLVNAQRAEAQAQAQRRVSEIAELQKQEIARQDQQQRKAVDKKQNS